MTNAELISSLANRVHIEQDSAVLASDLYNELEAYYAAESIDFFKHQKILKEINKKFRMLTGEDFVPGGINSFEHNFKDNMYDLGDLSGTITLYSPDEVLVVGSLLYLNANLTQPYNPTNPDQNIYYNYLIDLSEEYYITILNNEIQEIWPNLPQLTYTTDCNLQDLGTAHLAVVLATQEVILGERAFLDFSPNLVKWFYSGGTSFITNSTNVIVPESEPIAVTLAANGIVESIDPFPCYQ